MTSSPVDVSKLEAALEKATSRPWEFVVDHHQRGETEVGLWSEGAGRYAVETLAGLRNEHDAELIVAAVNLAPAFVALVRAVEALADELAGESDREQGYAKERLDEGNEHAYLACAARSQGYGFSARRLRAAVGAALNPQETGR